MALRMKLLFVLATEDGTVVLVFKGYRKDVPCSLELSNAQTLSPE